MTLTREDIETKVLQVLKDRFEMEDPGLEDDLREKHQFDSIDAIELLNFIEDLLDSELTQDEKQAAMDIRTIRDIVDYIVRLAEARA